MDYDVWIERERKIRSTLLSQSPYIEKTKIYRVCKDCKELFICFEDRCPNCNSRSIVNEKIDDKDFLVAVQNRIRCKFRYQDINLKNEKKHAI